MTTICMAIGLVFWFFVIRRTARLAFQHPQTSMALLRGAARMIRK